MKKRSAKIPDQKPVRRRPANRSAPTSLLKDEIQRFLSETGLEKASAVQLFAQVEGGVTRTLSKGFARQIAHDLDKMQSSYKEGKGNKIKLLEAAVRCGKMGVPLPSWVVDGIEEAFRRYITCEVRTMDEAFGMARPKGFHVGKMNEILTKSLRVYFHVERQRVAGRGVSDEFFDNVGREFGISGTKTKEYYYAWKNKLGNMIQRGKTPHQRS